jgi:hypothetical protein
LIVTSNSAPVLQHGSGLSSDFLAKILDVDTPPFPWKTQFYFALSSLIFYSLVKCSTFILSVIAQVVTCLLVVQPTRVPFPSRFFFFLITMYIMAMEAIKLHLFLNLCIYLFSFFLYSHSKTTGVQLVPQCVMSKIKLLLRNTFPECLIDNLTNSFHILTQRFVLFFHGD